MNTTESDILMDLRNDKRIYTDMIARMAVDEDGDIIDTQLLHFYTITINQIEADIARYSPEPIKYEVVITHKSGLVSRLAVKDKTEWTNKRTAQRHAADIRRVPVLMERYASVEVKEV